MIHFPSSISMVFIATMMNVIGIYDCSHKIAPIQNDFYQKDSIIFLQLGIRNWENIGTDITIYESCNYSVYLFSFGETKLLREGELARQDFIDIQKMVDTIYSEKLVKNYYEPFKTEYNWWGYSLNIKPYKNKEEIRFHSENDSIPDILLILVNAVRTLTTK